MVYCRKCGSPMEDGDHICLKCGNKVEIGNQENKKEDLIRKLSDYQVLLSECEELDTMIKPQTNFPVSEPAEFKKRSFIRYFWPFMVGAVAGWYIVYLLSVLISVQTNLGSYNPYKSSASIDSMKMNMMSDFFVGYLVAFIIAGAIIFIGIKISKSKQSAFNHSAEMMNIEVSERYKQGLLNEKMINIRQENVYKMRQYESLVPEQYRTSSLVGEIIGILKDDKAQTVEEACALI